jgi:polysaccharide biosynthesis transport protein
LAELEQNALGAERAVQEFKTQHGMVDTGRSGDGNAQFIDQKRVEELSTQLTAARAQTADAEAKLRRIEEVTGAASNAYRNDLLLAKSREEELSKRLNEAIRAFEIADRDRASLRSLEAVARGARTIYDNFVQRYSETLQQNFPVIEARVISPALPPLNKSSPKTLIVLGGALVAGVLLGLTTAFVRDSLDRGFRTPAQVEAILGVNCLGLLPMTESGEAPMQLTLSAKHGGERRAETCPRAMRKVLEDPFSRFSETVRGIKVALDLLNLTRPAQLVGVTSSVPGEGNSTFSANLAALAAQTGASTLLIDLDLRNPSLTRSLARPATEGVLEVWAGTLSLSDAVLVDEASGMHVLPAVVRSPIAHTHEILGSDRMRDIIRKARETYELIVVDLSPLEPVVDVRAIGGLLDSAVFVVE